MLTSPENFHSISAMPPFISTPAAATSIIRCGCTTTGVYSRWMAETPIHNESTIRVSALTKAASTPARW